MTYSISLWGHESTSEYFDFPAGWSVELACEHLEGPAEGLSLGQVATALKTLRPYWDDHCILVERMEGLR